jgi:parallel beta-helix repeat protein
MPEQQAEILTVCPKGCQFARIQEAIEAAGEGDVIQIGAGIYQENLVIKKQVTLSGISARDVFLKAAIQDEPTVLIKDTQGVIVSDIGISGTIGIQGEGASPSLLNNRIITREVGIKLISFEAGETVIRGNELISSGRGVGILLLGKASFLIHNNSITGLATGIVLGGAIFCDISDNLISNGWDGVVVGSSSNATIIGNQIMSNHNDGIRLSEAATVQISGNEVRENGGRGISLWQRPCYDTDDKFAGSIQVEDNNIRNNGRADLCPLDYPWPPGFVKED